MNNSYLVTIKTNFWNYSQTISAPSEGVATAKIMHEALHKNHDCPKLQVKEVNVKLEKASGILEPDSVQFNQCY